jgi:hypothetical protein
MILAIDHDFRCFGHGSSMDSETGVGERERLGMVVDIYGVHHQPVGGNVAKRYRRGYKVRRH